MARLIETFIPPIMEDGYNSAKAIVTTGTITGAGITSTTTVAAAGITSTAGLTSTSTTSAGVGYATGAGGTVTQITSRSTGVTINKLCGTIQTDVTSLAAAASAVFTVTNSTVAIGDTVIVSQRSGSTNAASVTGMTYVSVVAVAAGSFNIAVDNRSAATAEVGAIIINFAVIKAVTA